MNVAEYITKKMNGSFRENLINMHSRYAEMNGKFESDELKYQNLAWFAGSENTKYAWPVGSLVKLATAVPDRRFDIGAVSGYGTTGDIVFVKFGGDEEYGYCAWDLVKADVPDRILEIAKSMVKCPDLSRCPLKNEGACMKGGTE